MGNEMDDKHEVIEVNGRYMVALMGWELYRDDNGNVKKRWVVKRKYETFQTPLEAIAVADRWNKEDGLS